MKIEMLYLLLGFATVHTTAGTTFQSSLFSSFDSSRNLDLAWYHRVPRTSLDAREEKRLRPEHKSSTNRKKMGVRYGTSVVKERAMATASMSKRRQKSGDETAVRERILDATSAAFLKSGNARRSTLEVATGARVSKRWRYSPVRNK